MILPLQNCDNQVPLPTVRTKLLRDVIYIVFFP